jgi:hypothetical protein
MPAVAYQRASQRYDIEVPVILEDFRTGFFYNGTIYNYSTAGLYLESHYAPRPGRRIHVKVDGAYEVFNNNPYMAVIRWRRPLYEDSSDYSYGIGVKYC